MDWIIWQSETHLITRSHFPGRYRYHLHRNRGGSIWETVGNYSTLSEAIGWARKQAYYNPEGE